MWPPLSQLRHDFSLPGGPCPTAWLCPPFLCPDSPHCILHFILSDCPGCFPRPPPSGPHCTPSTCLCCVLHPQLPQLPTEPSNLPPDYLLCLSHSPTLTGHLQILHPSPQPPTLHPLHLIPDAHTESSISLPSLPMPALEKNSHRSPKPPTPHFSVRSRALVRDNWKKLHVFMVCYVILWLLCAYVVELFNWTN